MLEKVLVLDFGSQYTQLIARRVRELGIYTEIMPYNSVDIMNPSVKGLILSGSPFSVTADGHPSLPLADLVGKVPILGICYGAQLVAQYFGGEVRASDNREYGRAKLLANINASHLIEDAFNGSQVWMSHGDSVCAIPSGFEVTANTDTIPIAAFENSELNLYCVQFHPEVTHSECGAQLLENFAVKICKINRSWNPNAFITTAIQELRTTLGDKKVLCALSGGVDSTVAASLLHKAVGERLHCVFIDNGLLRKNEYANVLAVYQNLDLPVIGIDASEQFYCALRDVEDPEEKRKIIGRTFIEVFEEKAKTLGNCEFLAQGTIYPDVIESLSVKGPSATIKSHHNVGGLPERMHLQVVEPLRALFKDEVRKVGSELGIPQDILQRHPFPGPGLAIRILGKVTKERIALLQEADAIYLEALKNDGLYEQIWQAFAVLLPVNAVGVMGDERTYENVLALRAVTSLDGMTADWFPMPHEFLAKVANKIINTVRGINRVVYDISSKPPATIEWE